MIGDLTRVGANFHAMEAWSNLKRVNGDIGQIQSRLSTGNPAARYEIIEKYFLLPDSQL